MTRHKDILNTMAVDDRAPCSARVSAATEQIYAIYVNNQVYILINIL